MMTVTFENGHRVQFNDACFADSSPLGFTDLYDKKDGRWLAKVPNSCLIEAVRHCRVYNPLASVPNEDLIALKKEVAALRRKLYRKEKK